MQRPVSASQIATFKECKRKWGWRAVAKVVVDTGKSAALGTETHGQLEHYLETGDLDYTKESGYIAASGIPLLPKPGTKGILLEHPFTFTSKRGYVYHGFMDLVGPDSSVFPGVSSVGGPFPVVSDHKTTSDFKYAKTPETLREDPQALIYSVGAFQLYPTATQADLIWTYYKTRKPLGVKRVHLRVLKSDIETSFNILENTTQEIVTLHEKQTHPLDLPPSLSACNMYGGCPHHPSKGGGCTDLRQTLFNPEKKKMDEETRKMFEDLQRKTPEVARVTTALVNPPGEDAGVASAMPPKPEPAVPVAAKKTKKTRTTGTGTSKEYVLYIDCYPVGGTYVPAEELFAKAHAMVNETQQVADYRFIDYKGAGFFVAAVKGLLEEWTGGDLVLDSRTPEGALALTTMCSTAISIVRGMR